MSKYFQNLWIFIFLIRKTSFIHTCTSSYVLLPSSPKSPWMEYMLWVRCCVGVSLESSVIWCLSDISTSRLSWPDCTVGTPVSSCHRAVKWNMLTPQLKRHRKLCMESPNSRPSPNCSICCCYSILEARFRYTNIDPGGEFYPGRRSES